MFWLKSKKLEGDDLVNAVKALQDSSTSRKDKTKIFDDLRETFGGLIGKKMKQVSDLASNANERAEIRHHIESSFLEVLMDLTPKSAGEIVGYIAKAFGTKINRHSISEMLGKTEIIPDVNKYKVRFKNALRTFFKKHKRMPDFNKIDFKQVEDDTKDYESEDLKEFSTILKADVDQTLEILKLFGQGTIKSMYEEVAGDEGESALMLMDTLKSNEPLPDEVLKNKEIMRLFMQEVEKLPEDEKTVLLKYYHPNDPNADDLTSNEVASELSKKDPKFTERMVRHWIAIGREKLRESPKLKELYTASLINKLVKIAMLRYKTTEDMIFEVVASHNG